MDDRPAALSNPNTALLRALAAVLRVLTPLLGWVPLEVLGLYVSLRADNVGGKLFGNGLFLLSNVAMIVVSRRVSAVIKEIGPHVGSGPQTAVRHEWMGKHRTTPSVYILIVFISVAVLAAWPSLLPLLPLGLVILGVGISVGAIRAEHGQLIWTSLRPSHRAVRYRSVGGGHDDGDG
ncbi:MAG: hypothetical protein ABR573_10670 [Candidatus Dormibacteria bacterium]